MDGDQRFPVLRQVVLDATDIRELAEFYRQLLGWDYRAEDAPPPEGQPDTRSASSWPTTQLPDRRRPGHDRSGRPPSGWTWEEPRWTSKWIERT